MSDLISVVIPVYRDWSRLLRCLDAIVLQSRACAAIEVLVVNSDSLEAVPKQVSECEAVRVVAEPRIGELNNIPGEGS